MKEDMKQNDKKQNDRKQNDKKQNDKKMNDTTSLKAGETPYLSFKVLEELPFIRHGFSTKLGGVSTGIWESMNLGFQRGDEEQNVRENFIRICNAIGINAEDLVFTDQVHLANIRVATKADCGKGFTKQRDYKDIDALITKETGVPLLVYVADCVPIYLVDTKQKAIGLVHSGWKGTVSKIVGETITKMQQEFQTVPEDIIAVIGPSICMECYEVSIDVANQFMDVFTREQAKEIMIQTKIDKFHLNLQKANELILMDSGVLPSNITNCGICTACHSDLLFSHRATAGKRGNLAGFLQLI